MAPRTRTRGVTLEDIAHRVGITRAAASMALAEVLEQDLVLSVRFAAHHDFPEGIRAQIIDKDRQPRWQPAHLDDVTDAQVAAFFAP